MIKKKSISKIILATFGVIPISGSDSFSQISSPPQPTSGPGGSNYIHQSVTKNKYGSGGTAYWLYEPANPKPDSANVIIFNHGWGALNPACYGKWIEHLVRKGNLIIFPKWQYDLNTFPQYFTPNATTAVKDAVNELAGNNHVKPRYYNTAYIGYSFGGVISANLAILADSAGIPAPKALLVCNGGNGGTQGSLLPTYSDMPDIKLLIISGENDVVVADTFGRMLFDSTMMVNPLFKNHITQYYDGHGSPVIEATHNEPISWDSAYWSSDFFDNNWVVNASYGVSKSDAVDFFCYWKFADAIADCAFYGTNCQYVFCKTPEEKFMGNWSDNIPVKELFVEAKTTCVSSVEIEDGRWKMEDGGWKVYPNPSDGEFNLKISGFENLNPSNYREENIKLKIYNVLGEVVYQKALSPSPLTPLSMWRGEGGAGIDVSTQPQGIYFLVLNDGEKTFSQKLLIE